MTTGEKIKFERLKAGYTQEQLAEKLLVSRQAIAKWESGRGVPDIENLRALATFFDLSFDDLLNPDGKKKPGKKRAKAEGEKGNKPRYILLVIVIALLLVAVILAVILFGNGKFLFGATNGSMSETSSKDTSSVNTSHSTSSEDSSSHGSTSPTPSSSSYTPTPPISSIVSSDIGNNDYNEPPQENLGTVLTSQQLTYTLSGGKATITDADENLSGDVIIPAAIDGCPVVAIGENAFAGCLMTNVVISEGIESIGYCAFMSCAYLESVVIPKTVETIEEGAFFYSRLLNITVDPHNQNYYMKNGCLIEKETGTLVASVGNNITTPAGIRRIGEGVFYLYAGYATTVTIPESVVEIGKRAFGEGFSLTISNLPANLKVIDASAFWCCTFYENFIIPDTVTKIGRNAFGETTVKNVKLGKGISKIEQHLFECSKVETIRIPKNVTEIGDQAFRECRRLTDVYFEGTEQDRNNMLIGTDNEYLLNANWHYESY